MMVEIDGRVRERIANELLPDVVGDSSEIDVDVPISLD
jgi:hypothetical protein